MKVSRNNTLNTPIGESRVVNEKQDRSAIEVRHLYVSFSTSQGELSILEDFDFDVFQNEFVCVVGPSGAGKTTLLNVLAGFISPTSGSVIIDGHEVQRPGRERGVVFQDYAVFPWLTVWQNIEFGLKLRSARCSPKRRTALVEHYLEMMDLKGFAHSFPKVLSGGMRQRVAIARAYATEPRLLLMDEPFGALDAQTRERMQEQLLTTRHNSSQAVVFITHSVEEAIFLADRILVLSNRPATVEKTITVPFGIDRDASTRLAPEFLEMRRTIESALRQESNK